MKRILLLLAFSATFIGSAQNITLKKGVVIDSLVVNDTVPETFSLYLPKKFDVSKTWPVVFVFDMNGRGKQSLAMFSAAAEEQGYVLAASNNISDTLSISKNILITSRMLNTVTTMLPIRKNGIYTSGFSAGGRFSTLIPTFIKGVEGVIACGAAVANFEVLTSRNPFHFIGVVGDEDFSYSEMLTVEKVLSRMKFPNQLLVFNGGHEWPKTEDLSSALRLLTLAAMAKGIVLKDEAYVDANYTADLVKVNRLYTANKPLLADNWLEEMSEVYQPFISLDSIKESRKAVRRSRLFKNKNRTQNALSLKESLIKEEYNYYLEEDILTYNYNNLGWWKYQMEELQKFQKNPEVLQQKMGKRLEGYVKALVSDNVDVLSAEDPIDGEALNFLWMLKTVIEPDNFESYLKIISYTAKTDDYGTALFYLEELLKKGYKNRSELYALENTALLRITPEFNELVEKYLKGARYSIIEE
ncbi:alpha/beta hydrolase [Zobellia barbeyronii]|uniref:Alpha/beta hydrolase n=1 Tax=Zobellia barbeyronii TaxID=2748009 RepID=A0ABS5WFJ7_9FLAO|nr:alpha/beta hydrolase [Zobellia barbeyronii]MBT2162156.1 alpha/beta hydrolase [Zobellia barbeyronii]